MTALSRPPSVEERTAGWFPSRWGPDDQAGALNEITPAVVLDAVRLVRTGTVHELAHVLHAGVPAFPGRTYRSYLTTNYHFVNRRRANGSPDLVRASIIMRISCRPSGSLIDAITTFSTSGP